MPISMLRNSLLRDKEPAKPIMPQRQPTRSLQRQPVAALGLGGIQAPDEWQSRHGSFRAMLVK
jgi:hypothetical protein